MKNNKFYYGIGMLLSVFILTACDEDFTAGVSLGGSGSGAEKPNQTGEVGSVSRADNERPLTELHGMYFVTAPKVMMDHCLGVDREMKLVNKDDGMLLSANQKYPFDSIKLVVTLYNNTAQAIFEQIPACMPITVHARSAWDALTEHQITPSFTCPKQTVVQVLQPFSQRMYEIDLSNMKYNGILRMTYSSELSSVWMDQSDAWQRCADLTVELPISTENDDQPK